MKIAVLFTVVALAGASNYPDEPFGHLKLDPKLDSHQAFEEQWDLAQGIYLKIQPVLELNFHKTYNVFEKIDRQISVLYQNILDAGKLLLNDILHNSSEILENVNQEIQGANNIVSECLETTAQKLRTIGEEAFAKANECSGTLIEEIDNLKSSVNESLAVYFYAEIEELETKFRYQCYDVIGDIFDQVNCFVRFVPQTTNAAFHMFKKVEEFFYEYYNTGILRADYAHECFIDVIDLVRADAKTAKEEFYECLQQPGS
ncbi:uncharacterized protein LOC129749469 [Uranotaenia lowii]|uniref:uncharacterized protein LOC129749469 n=1 Tax=Uranotaenia lowii TaxID=190385 RepID=UPI002479BE9E|nr:uncharacterized protein LOC129749469 [Uranotaenia lowii]